VKLATVVTPVIAGTTTSGKTQALAGTPGILATAATKITAEKLNRIGSNSSRDAYNSSSGGEGVKG
jgi:hypothetical protein